MTDNQPIPVAEAVEAVRAAIEVCGKATPGPWALREPCDDDPSYWLVTDEADPWALAEMAGGWERRERTDEWPEALDGDFIVAARAGYAGMLEYLWKILDMTDDTAVLIPHVHMEYFAVAPIVEWHRAQGGTR